MVDRKFPKKYRLSSKKTIDELFKKGKFQNHGLLKFKSLPQKEGYSRFVISISKRVGNAPERNLLKRLIREALRLSGSIGKHSVDCAIFITSKPREKPALTEIQKSISYFFSSLPL